MKKSLSRVIIVLVSCLIPSLVNATSACSYSEQAELNNIAGNVKASFEFKEEVIPNGGVDPDNGEPMDITNYYFQISIVNITDKIYVSVKSEATGEEKNVYVSDTNNGVVQFKQEDIDNTNQYTINVYSNNDNCKGELFRTFALNVPLANPYADIGLCKDFPEYTYCKEFLTEPIEIEDFMNGINAYVETHKKNDVNEEQNNIKKENKIIKFYKDHTLVINMTAFIVVVIGVATTVILVKRKRSRVL